ncbi:MAG: hypothetical protein JO323_17415 [Acidobacteriia bacterium]|nr:hypothetical protein [Terriglobia bacterium]
MQNNVRSAIMAGILSAFCLFDGLLSAQPTLDLNHVRAVDRVLNRIDQARRVTLIGNRHPLARPEFDLGPALPDFPMERIALVLRPDAAQQQALEDLLSAQKNPDSPYYHQWLTPEAFGRSFGVSENDLHAVVSWLEDQGFTVESVPASRRVIMFSGTAATVESAFHTAIHRYNAGGKVHHANAADPQIPAALTEVVSGLMSLHDFTTQPQHLAAAPDYTNGSSHYLSPADFGAIYNLNPLYASSTNGTGQSIAIAGRSNINLSDVQTFRASMGLPANSPAVIVNGTNPGVIAGSEQGEATLDVEWAGAVARNAAIQFVVSASTNSSDGVNLSAQYIVNQNLAPIVSVSFGDCESAIGTAGNQFWNALWQQAAAQGMSVFVAAGDSGAAGCDVPSSSAAISGRGINGLCSSPYSTCVGGTEFNDTANPALYWSSANTSNSGSAVSYIPEMAWNESSLAGGSGLWAGGGGASLVYPKPSWQIAPGVPTDNHRYVPDVSLTSAAHDSYMVCLNGQLYAFSGTSAATPAFAGITALVLQRQGARQGNVNSNLYVLASSQAIGGSAVFHDVTGGNNSVNGVAGFSASTGYDAATGLGSVDGNMLVNSWTSSSRTNASFQMSASSNTIAVVQAAAATTAITLTVSGGFNSPIALSASALPSGLTATYSTSLVPAPGSGSSTLTITAGAQVAPGTYHITATASGGGLTQTVPLTVTVAAKCSYSLSQTTAQEPSLAGSYFVSLTATPGCTWMASSNVSWLSITAGASGAGSGNVSFSLTANTAATARQAVLTIAGMPLMVTQSASLFSLSAASATVSAGGGAGSFVLLAPSAGAAWTAKSNASWITLTSAVSGAGNATVTYSVAANAQTAFRTGTLTVGGLTFTVTQPGVSCSYSISFGTMTATATGFTDTASVTTPAACTWTAASNVSWITVTPSGSKTGNGTITFALASNSGSGPRTGTITVAGYIITITEGTRPAVQVGRPLGLVARHTR